MEDQFRKVDFIGTIAGKKEIAKRTWEVAIEIEDKDFSFEAGQYVWVELRGLAFDDPAGSRRAFSISSSPREKGRIKIIFRASESGYKKTLLQMPAGSKVDIIGPFGSAFLLPEESKEGENYVLAGGVGIAPFLCWIRFFAEKGFGSRHIKMFYLNNSRKEAVYLEEMERIAAENKDNFQLINIFKKFAWSDIASHVSDLGGKWYVTGSQGAVNYFSQILLGAGITPSQTIFENFWPAKEVKSGLEEAVFEERILNSVGAFEGADPKIDSGTERERFLNKFLSPLLAIGAVFSAAMAVLHSFIGGQFYIYILYITSLSAICILWQFWKRGKQVLLSILLVLTAFIFNYPLVAEGYGFGAGYWISSFPVIAFLLLGKKGRQWGLVYIIFLIFLGVLDYVEILILQYHGWDLAQIALSTLFIYLLCVFYDLIFLKAGHSMDYEVVVSRIFRDAVQSSTNHIIITDRNGIIKFANKAAQESTGFTFSEMKNNTPRLWGGLMGNDFYKELWKKKLSGESLYGEIINRRKNFEKYHTLASISPIKSKDGRVLGFIGTETDITDIRKTEKQLTVTQARFLQMAETIDSVFWIISLETGKVLFVSRAYENIWGGNREDLYKDPMEWFVPIHPEDKKRITDNLQSTIKTKTGYSEEYRLLKAGGEIVYIRDAGFIVQNGPEAGKLLVGLARDVTKEKQIDLAKTEFVSLASHQLNAPLNASRWYLEMLLGGDAGKLTKDQKKYLNQVYESNKRLIELVATLLDISRIELGTLVIELESIDIKKVCRELVAELKPQISQNKISIKESFDSPPLILADKKFLRVVIQNLLTNAIKYTPEKGEVNISAPMLPAGETMGGVKLKENSFVITVSDSGYGIPKNEQNRIFSKLFRASNIREKVSDGIGLGLYMVKQIVDASGGNIWFESTEGKGTTFYVSFPVTGMKNKEENKSLL